MSHLYSKQPIVLLDSNGDTKPELALDMSLEDDLHERWFHEWTSPSFHSEETNLSRYGQNH